VLLIALITIVVLMIGAAGWVVLGKLDLPGRAATRLPNTATIGSPATLTGRPAPLTTTVLNPRHNPGDFQAGATVLVYGNDPAFGAKTRTLLDRLAGLGANSVGLAFPIFQSDWRAADVHADPAKTPNLTNMALFVAEAHRRGYTVMLRPLLDEESLHPAGRWRGTISPADPVAWFRSYDALMVSYAQFAELNRVDVMDIGTEFVSLQARTSDWLKVIRDVKSAYSGEVTYSANWDAPYPAFGSQLSFLSMDAFYPLRVPAGASIDSLKAAWRPWMDQIVRLGQTTGKRVIFSELGVTSETGSFQSPWTWQHGTGVSLETQRRYYAASCQATKPHLAGIYWWVFDLDPLTSPTTDVGYTPSGKPAEIEISQCFH
jgi:glycosyl hydrolase family 113